MINTLCDKCIFAISENGKQTGCKLSRLEKFKELDVVELQDSGFYKINKLCITCRNSNNPYKDPEKEVLEEVAPKITAVLDCRDSKFDIEYFKFLIEEGIYQVIVVFKDQKISEYNSLMSDCIKGTKSVYRIIKFLEEQPIETVYKNIKGNYILIGELEPGLVKEFSDSIVFDLKQFLVYSINNSYIVSSLLFKYKSQKIDEILSYLEDKENYKDFICLK
jgi:hypothetical protein